MSRAPLFDPWPLVEAWGEVQATSVEQARKRWARLHRAFEAAQARHSERLGVAGPTQAREGESPRERLEAAEECMRLRPKIEAGDGGAVLDAVAHCAAAGLAMPEWLADEYLRRHGAVGRAHARDWNDEAAFGVAYPKGTNIAGLRAIVEHSGPAYSTAAELLAADPGRAIDRALYEDVGARLGLGQTRVQELIGDYLRRFDGVAAPLKYLRDRMRAGRTLEQAHREWEAERFERWFAAAPGSSGK